MKPISDKMLIHTVTHNKRASVDEYNNPTYITVSLTKVRVQPTVMTAVDRLGNKIQLNGLLFYDCTKSFPKANVFNQLDQIIFNGNKYLVRTVVYLYDDKKLHHVEAGLE